MQKGFGSIYLLFIILIITSFLVGIKFSENTKLSDNKPIPTQQLPTPTTRIELGETLIKRCGDIPEKAYPEYGKFDMRNGPEWSSDCRHIAWSMWESGTSYLGNDAAILKQLEDNPRKLTGREGVFLYNDAKKNVITIYSPKELDETPVFHRWIDSQNLIFEAKSTRYNYNIVNKETTLISP